MSSPRSGDTGGETSGADAADAVERGEEWAPAVAEAHRVQVLIASLRRQLEPEDIVTGPALDGTGQ